MPDPTRPLGLDAPASPGDFGAELRRWRSDVRGMSQGRVAALMGFDRSYVSQIENGSQPVTASFAAKAEEVLQTGGALLRLAGEVAGRRPRGSVAESPLEVRVVADRASLHYDGSTYTARQQRTIYNGGTEPITRYMIRISVDRYPGSPDRSNALYREQPLRWEDLHLDAEHEPGGPMRWEILHDRDAVKEVFLLFDGPRGRFPLYPGQTATITYQYQVADTQWGHWFQRSVRLPTDHLSVELDFPDDLAPDVWGQETTMAASALPLRTPIEHLSAEAESGRAVFRWSTDSPPLHARYRLEWAFRARSDAEPADIAPARTATDVMRGLGIVQRDDAQLRAPAQRFTLPGEAEDARRVVAQLAASMDRVAGVHDFSKGMGIAAPQIGISHAAAIVRTSGGDQITLLNARIIDASAETDEQYEGCLSFFDVRGLVPSPLWIDVEHQLIDGQHVITRFTHGDARLVRHELDHLNGQLYTDRMRPGVQPIPVSQYQGTGQTWQYQP